MPRQALYFGRSSKTWKLYRILGIPGSSVVTEWWVVRWYNRVRSERGPYATQASAERALRQLNGPHLNEGAAV